MEVLKTPKKRSGPGLPLGEFESIKSILLFRYRYVILHNDIKIIVRNIMDAQIQYTAHILNILIQD